MASAHKSNVEKLRSLIEQHLKYTLCANLSNATNSDIFYAVSMAVRHYQQDNFFISQERQFEAKKKRIYYISMEFLIGQSLRNNVINLGLLEPLHDVLNDLGFCFNDILDEEPDAALGNGGLGRLAACFMDSMATLGIAGSGHGIKYEYGLFRQSFIEGKQVEHPDDWHSKSSPWLVEQHSQQMIIPVGGFIEHTVDTDGNYNPMWMGWKIIVGIPNDYLVSGYMTPTTNKLRLYSAVASDSFDIKIFNSGDYISAVSQKIETENISKILYPSDEVLIGKELRFTQEYFLVACTLRDVLRDYSERGKDISLLPDYVAIQLNDTHPALTIVELMRMLVDEYHVTWDLAWDITQKTCSFTNHTLMPEALEMWPVTLFEKFLPRHLQILYELNHRFLTYVSEQWPDKPNLLSSLSLFDSEENKNVRMAHVAILGSHCVNGVAKLHSELIIHKLVPDFYFINPIKFTNQTNGVTPRRWLQQANPELSQLLSFTVGEEWPTDLTRLTGLERLVEDTSFIDKIRNIKLANKEKLCKIVSLRDGMNIDPMAMFDCQVKRVHEYKRQLLNILHVISLYLDIKEKGKTITPKVHFFAGKAAPGYQMAKLIIQFINLVAKKVNNDPCVGDQLKIVFLEDYKVSLAERIIPATDLSEQISMAGTEASGTSNMKFAMNGALTIGTLDGANIEIREEVGADNFYLFGLSSQEITEKVNNGDNNKIYGKGNPEIDHVVDSLVSGMFSTNVELFAPLHTLLTRYDNYCHLLDFESYRLAQQQAMYDYGYPAEWHKKALLNISRMGTFSSDRTIQGYAKSIWGIDC